MRLSTRDVAEILGTTASNVHKLVQGGRLKAHRRGRGSPLIFDSRSVYIEMQRSQKRRARA